MYPSSVNGSVYDAFSPHLGFRLCSIWSNTVYLWLLASYARPTNQLLKSATGVGLSVLAIFPKCSSGLSTVHPHHIGESCIKLRKNERSLPHQIKGTEFEDLTFYKEERIILAICAHEHFAYMNLEDDEYEGFAKLNILHEVIGFSQTYQRTCLL